MRPQKYTHWIRPNDSEAMPSRVIVIDTEARTDRAGGTEVQSWRLGCGRFYWWTRDGNIRFTEHDWKTPADMWADITAFCRDKKRTILYAHNLAYDIRISQALTTLPGLGWEMAAIRIEQRGSWSSWRSGGKSLVLCDSASIFPVTLYTIGKTVGAEKLPLPDGGDEDAWWSRCRRDVAILSAAIIQYFEWLRTGIAGAWALTGSSQAWHHWRHSHYTHPVQIHEDDDAHAAERRAMWTGRAENWVWGKNYECPTYEWDWQYSYPRIAADVDLPVRLVGSTGAMSLRAFISAIRNYRVLADVTITTANSIVPTKWAHGIVWPVGTFDTTLWDSEILLAQYEDCEITINRAWLYAREPALREWAQWIMYSLDHPRSDWPRWMPLVLKAWSRSLIGRFAMRYSTWDDYVELPYEALRVGHLVDYETGEVTDTFQIGRKLMVKGPMKDPTDACPQITSYVMSEARARLWYALRAAGADNVLYMDTDSLILNSAGHRNILDATNNGFFPGLRLKSEGIGYEIYGPRMIEIAGQTKMSGIPRGSIKTGENTRSAQVWNGLEQSLREGNSGNVIIRTQQFTTRYNDKRRARTESGRTVPYRLPGGTPALRSDTGGAVGACEPSTGASRYWRADPA